MIPSLAGKIEGLHELKGVPKGQILEIQVKPGQHLLSEVDDVNTCHCEFCDATFVIADGEKSPAAPGAIFCPSCKNEYVVF